MEKTQLKTVLGAGMVLVAVLLFVFLLRPVNAEVSDLRDNVESTNVEILAEKNRLTLLTAEKEELNLLTEVALNEVRGAVPSKMQQDVVIRNLVSIADENIIELNSISFGKGGENEEGIAVLRVNASFEGGFNDLIRFLEGLEGNKRKFVMNSLSVQLATIEVGGSRRANFSLAMETYFLNN